MEILEPYIKNRLTIALKADNGRYLSVVDDYYVGISWWVRPIEAFKKTKDHSCQFYINQVDNDTITIQAKSMGGMFISRLSSMKFYKNIIGTEISYDQYSEFEVFASNDGKISIKADNGKFWSRIYYTNGPNKIAAVKDQIDIFSKFTVESGSD